MNELELFENQEFGSIRVVEINGEPWFVAVDICNALDIGNPSQALTRLDFDEVTLISNEGKRGMNVINESGLYELILGSRKKEAKDFKRWIKREVLPSIRKTGTYSMIPKTYSETLRALADEVEKNQKLLEGNAAQKRFIESVQPKQSTYSETVKEEETFLTTTVAKRFGITARKLNNILYMAGIQYPIGEKWYLYNKYVIDGIGRYSTRPYKVWNGTMGKNTFLCWTEKGIDFIKDVLEERGYLQNEETV